MTKQELASILVTMVNDAQFTADDIAETAKLSRKYGIEIRKGIRLSKYVKLI